MKAYSEPFNNTREIVKFINDNDIKREDIVAVIDRKTELYLIYYK